MSTPTPFAEAFDAIDPARANRAAIDRANMQIAQPQEPGFYLLLLVIVGGINTAISLFYYLRVVKVMTIDPEPADRPPLVYSDVSLAGAYLWLITLPTAGLIVTWDWLSELANAAARNLIS